MDITLFEEKIKEQEDQLFGIKLYMMGIRKTYGDNEEIIEMNETAFRNILERGEYYTKKAKQLLEDVKKKPENTKLLHKFIFPPIQGHPFLDEMTKRAKFLVKAYEMLFPHRPREMPLTEQEYNLLEKKIISDF